ncbi:MAG: winged helix-turn-helix transcriptional regulator [Mariniphaga sp.]|nr:winged helix-turn-helix transcriptional regulator [Mariniphaga sp.]
MEIEKGKTAKYLKEKRPVSKEVTEQLKYFIKTKKRILNALKEEDKSVPQLAQELNIPADEVMFQLMSLLKYGLIETGEIDDMDEYFQYKIKNNGQDKS